MSHDPPRSAAVNRAQMHKVLAVLVATMSNRSGDIRFYILHAVPANYPFSWHQHERLELLTSLRERAERAGVPVRTVEQHGDPARVIVLHANSRKADLVVLGSNRRRGWQRFREGSVGEKVLRRAAWAVLIVPWDVPRGQPDERLRRHLMATKPSTLESRIKDLLPELERVYSDIHAHPELSMQETRTARVAVDRLRDAGYDVTDEIGQTGVVGLLRNGEGPTVMLRADMDALPVREQTGLPYASTRMATDSTGKTVPVMHACGHDMHVTWLIGAATLLAQTREAWKER